jgi:hypothetical protein
MSCGCDVVCWDECKVNIQCPADDIDCWSQCKCFSPGFAFAEPEPETEQCGGYVTDPFSDPVMNESCTTSGSTPDTSSDNINDDDDEDDSDSFVEVDPADLEQGGPTCAPDDDACWVRELELLSAHASATLDGLDDELRAIAEEALCWERCWSSNMSDEECHSICQPAEAEAQPDIEDEPTVEEPVAEPSYSGGLGEIVMDTLHQAGETAAAAAKAVEDAATDLASSVAEAAAALQDLSPSSVSAGPVIETEQPSVPSQRRLLSVDEAPMVERTLSSEYATETTYPAAEAEQADTDPLAFVARTALGLNYFVVTKVEPDSLQTTSDFVIVGMLAAVIAGLLLTVVLGGTKKIRHEYRTQCVMSGQMLAEAPVWEQRVQV